MYIHLFGLRKRVNAEFVCWFSPGKLSKDPSVKMPLELPTSESLPVTSSAQMVSAQPNTSTGSTSGSIVISKESVLTSMCDTLLNHPSSTHTDISKTIDLVVVSTGACTQAGQFSTTTTSSPTTYKLCEIVSREKDVLFQNSNSSEVELEPARENVYSVRRRSRQFFTVTEEEENESDSDNHALSVDQEKTVKIDPIFNLGDSLKRLYFPHHHHHHHHKEHPKRERKVRTFSKKRPGSAESHGYESDPEGKVGLLDIVKNDPGMKAYNSHPELNMTETVALDESVHEFKSKSLPTTPRVSPKLLRRNSLKNSEKKEVQKTGPGFSFLASVAGELHKRKNPEKQLEKGIKKVSPGSSLGPSSGTVAVTETSESKQVAKSQTGTIMDSKEPSRSMHTHHVHDFSESTGIDLESHDPISLSSFVKWGTTKKIKITNKESNMFSPTSF
ncbi:uncharacterized protein LOC132741345 isoform X2 [Ruditapes philippinarum]|uniref:uncharacterized protein LOC132741345 isoform X2 n=1 Tax=Ruditapes philippinarum TaxID=129788 RepID=UPI00295B5B2A|nr:uncharacterized protein LOC132741345 isoform X2 [Ruditapes philippinarum]